MLDTENPEFVHRLMFKNTISHHALMWTLVPETCDVLTPHVTCPPPIMFNNEVLHETVEVPSEGICPT